MIISCYSTSFLTFCLSLGGSEFNSPACCVCEDLQEVKDLFNLTCSLAGRRDLAGWLIWQENTIVYHLTNEAFCHPPASGDTRMALILKAPSHRHSSGKSNIACVATTSFVLDSKEGWEVLEGRKKWRRTSKWQKQKVWRVLSWKLKERGLETWQQSFCLQDALRRWNYSFVLQNRLSQQIKTFIYLFFLNKCFRFQRKHCSYQYHDLNGWNWRAVSAFPASTVTGGRGAISAVSGWGAGLQPGQADGSSQAAQRHKKHLLAVWSRQSAWCAEMWWLWVTFPSIHQTNEFQRLKMKMTLCESALCSLLSFTFIWARFGQKRLFFLHIAP